MLRYWWERMPENTNRGSTDYTRLWQVSIYEVAEEDISKGQRAWKFVRVYKDYLTAKEAEDGANRLTQAARNFR